MPIDHITPEDKRSSSPLYIDLFAAQAMVAVISSGVFTVVGTLPRNPDNSMQAVFTVPTFLILSVTSGLLLWTRVLPHRALRIVCWFFVALAVVAIPATLADVAWGTAANHQ